MLKISQVGPPNHTITLRLEGRLVGPWVAEAGKTFERVISEGRMLKLDLAEVEFIDTNGLALLSSLKSRGVWLVECSPFIAEQLKTGTNG